MNIQFNKKKRASVVYCMNDETEKCKTCPIKEYCDK